MLNALPQMLTHAVHARHDFFDERHEATFRLFNGYFEGWPGLIVDLYGSTLLLHNAAEPPGDGDLVIADAQTLLLEELPWVQCVVVKERHGVTDEARRGRVVYAVDGAAPNREVREHGVRYAIDLLMNRDASFYLDTRNLRRWLIDSMAGKQVLNTFAYTSSLGVAAQAAGAARVVHADLNRRFLNVAKTSYTLNGFPINKKDFQTGDFWSHMNRLKRMGERFDCVLVDPPFFSTTKLGTIDVAQNMTRLINKVRPIVKDGGQIVAVNNGLYVSGVDYMAELTELCADGHVTIQELIDVGADCAGFAETRVGEPITDPTPFNHSTKIVVLGIKHRSNG